MTTTIIITQPTIQHITKASSDQLLTKFAELDSPKKSHSLRSLKRPKRSAHSTPPAATRRESAEFTGGVLAERKALLVPLTPGCRTTGAAAFVRQLKVGRVRSFKKRSFFGTIEKTWKRTVDGASKVFMEKQYNRHKRLLSDTI